MSEENQLNYDALMEDRGTCRFAMETIKNQRSVYKKSSTNQEIYFRVDNLFPKTE